MLIISGSEKLRLHDAHAFARAIVVLAQAYRGESSSSASEGKCITTLWPDLGEGHRRLLAEIARRPGGIAQSELECILGITWQQLRGVHNGLSRICERLGLDKPIRTLGYNSKNRRYLTSPEIGSAVRQLTKYSQKGG
jgi:hypothetical protein